MGNQKFFAGKGSDSVTAISAATRDTLRHLKCDEATIDCLEDVTIKCRAMLNRNRRSIGKNGVRELQAALEKPIGTLTFALRNLPDDGDALIRYELTKHHASLEEIASSLDKLEAVILGLHNSDLNRGRLRPNQRDSFYADHLAEGVLRYVTQQHIQVEVIDALSREIGIVHEIDTWKRRLRKVSSKKMSSPSGIK